MTYHEGSADGKLPIAPVTLTVVAETDPQLFQVQEAGELQASNEWASG